MGGGSWSSDAWTSYSTRTTVGKAKEEIFTSRGMKAELDPKGITIRESRDSADNPNSTALAIFCDVTGSMGMISEAMIRTGMNTLATEIYTRKPISDPHMLFGGVGDVNFDKAPLQATQFEADIRVAEQLKDIYLEGGGGGNSFESYLLPWYFAAMHTSIDCFEKRGKKGYLFTAGDEQPEMKLTKEMINKVFGYTPEQDYDFETLYTMVSRKYEVYHLMVEQGNHMRSYSSTVIKKWRDLMDQRAILLSDYTKMSEVIVSIIQATEGAAKEDIIKSWDGSTGLVVSKAINDLVATGSSTGSVVMF